MGSAEKIKDFCRAIATLGSLGEWWLGGMIASIFAIPVLLFFQSIYALSNTIFYWSLGVSIVLLVLVVQITLWADSEKRDSIVVDKLVGIMIALAGISLRWRIIFFGFLLYHILSTVKPFWRYRRLTQRLRKLPGIFGVFTSEVLTGFIINIFLRLIAWVMGG